MIILSERTESWILEDQAGFCAPLQRSNPVYEQFTLTACDVLIDLARKAVVDSSNLYVLTQFCLVESASAFGTEQPLP